MANGKVELIDLRAILNGYADEVSKGLLKAQKTVAKETTDQIKSKAPKRTGAYASDWAFKRQRKGYTVYNRKHYQLTHLLEFGHALRNGGRSQAYPHIKPAENFAIKEYTKEAERVIKNVK